MTASKVIEGGAYSKPAFIVLPPCVIERTSAATEYDTTVPVRSGMRVESPFSTTVKGGNTVIRADSIGDIDRAFIQLGIPHLIRINVAEHEGEGAVFVDPPPSGKLK
jgi:hypothetical protein